MIYAEKILKDEAKIDWTRPAVEVDRHIRGLSPFPGAKCQIGEEQVKLLASRLAQGQGTPGEVLQALPELGLTIACGSGAIEVLSAQRPGKRAMAASDLLRGFELPDYVS